MAFGPVTPQQSLDCQSYLTLENPGNTPDIDSMMEAGFSFSGDDTFYCTNCCVSLACWKQTDNAWKEHAQHSPQCAYLLDKRGQAYIDKVQAELATIYKPHYPPYSKLDARRRTYVNPNWPADGVRLTTEQLAGAGLFYTGEGATVKCHYCDTSLSCLSPHAEPWANHALLFPFCKYLIRMKGVDFVENFTATRGIDLPVSRVSLTPSTPAQILRSMRYSSEVITAAINQHISNTGGNGYRVGDLLHLLSNMDGGGEVVDEHHDLPSFDEVEEMNRRLSVRRL